MDEGDVVVWDGKLSQVTGATPLLNLGN